MDGGGRIGGRRTGARRIEGGGRKDLEGVGLSKGGFFFENEVFLKGGWGIERGEELGRLWLFFGNCVVFWKWGGGFKK